MRRVERFLLVVLILGGMGYVAARAADKASPLEQRVAALEAKIKALEAGDMKLTKLTIVDEKGKERIVLGRSTGEFKHHDLKRDATGIAFYDGEGRLRTSVGTGNLRPNAGIVHFDANGVARIAEGTLGELNDGVTIYFDSAGILRAKFGTNGRGGAGFEILDVYEQRVHAMGTVPPDTKSQSE